MTTLDFELEIGPGVARSYPVTARAPGGEASATMCLPVALAELDHQLARVGDAVLASSVTAGDVRTAGPQPVRELGQRLFEALVTDDVRSLYVTSSQSARAQGSVLRLGLRVRPPELARLPWEFLFNPGRQEYVGLSLPLVRYPGLLAPRPPLLVAAPLQVLGMVACPQEQHSPSQHLLKVDDEQRRLRAALTGLERDGLVELSWVTGQTYGDLENALEKGPWHVLHFVGLGGYDRDTGEGSLTLADAAGRADLVGAEDFSRLLAAHDTLRLVVLSACNTGRGSAWDAFSTVAGALVRRSVPAVVAMQCDITDQSTIVFSQTLYKNVARRLAVDASVVRARQALRLVKKDTLEWGSPVLYLRAPDGNIFDSVHSADVRVSHPGHSRGHTHHRATAPEVEALYDEALAAYWTERWDRAIALLQQVLAHRPQHPDAAVKLEQARDQQRFAAQYRTGLRLLDVGQWQQAVDALTLLDPGYRDTAALLARARRELPGCAPPLPDSSHLDRHPRVVLTVRHGEAVTAVAFSPDGRRLATGSHDETARIWDAASGQECLTARHKGLRSNVRGRATNVRGRAVQAVAFSPDGRLLATAGDDYTARVWDATTGHQLARFTHDNVVRAVAFSPDGLRLATAGDDRTVRIWGITSGKKFATLTHDNQVYAVAFSPDGHRLVTVSGDRTARLWEATSGAKLATFIHGQAVLGVAFSPDGRRLATGGDDHTARVWDVGSGAQLALLVHGNRVWAVAFSPDGRELATAGDDYTARIWNAADGRELAILTHDSQVYGVAYRPDGHHLATAGRNGTAYLWSLDQHPEDG